MTSKEFIENLKNDGIYYCKECNLKGCDNCKKERNIQFDNVIRDLEVLDILRKNLDLEIIDVCKTYGIYKVHIANLHQELTIDENEFKLVKEWIENGKKGI